MHGAAEKIDLLQRQRRHGRRAAKPLQFFNFGNRGQSFFFVAQIRMHLRQFKPEQIVARILLDQCLQNSHGVSRAPLAAIDGSQQDRGVGTVELALAPNRLHCADAFLAVSSKAHHKTQGPPRPREAAHDIVMHALGHARVHQRGIDLGDAIVQFTALRGVA